MEEWKLNERDGDGDGAELKRESGRLDGSSLTAMRE